MVVCIFCYAQRHTKPRVRRAPGLPCALRLERATKEDANLGDESRENAKLYPRHCERSEAIHCLLMLGKMDCFA